MSLEVVSHTCLMFWKGERNTTGTIRKMTSLAFLPSHWAATTGSVTAQGCKSTAEIQGPFDAGQTYLPGVAGKT